MERIPPLNNIDVGELSTEALVMLFIFFPNYFNHPEGGLVSAARDELARRGAIEIDEDKIKWLLDEETKVELLDMWTVERMSEGFRSVVKPPRKRK